MNQFHTPSFGDEVFEMNDTPLEQTQHQIASRRISRLSSLDHSTLDDDEEDGLDYETNPYNSSNMMSANQQQQQLQPPQPLQQLLPQPQPQLNQPPAKPLAPYALFFRDTMTAIKQQNPSCTLDQVTSIALNMWDSIDEKQKSVYDQRHEVEKREYMRLLRDYQRNQQLEDTVPQLQEEQQLQQPSTVEPITATVAEISQPETNSAVLSQPPDQIQLLTEAAAVQKCTRDQCNKPAIINPDWEDEYCSNECVVIHCRNVFSEWARSLQNSPT